MTTTEAKVFLKRIEFWREQGVEDGLILKIIEKAANCAAKGDYIRRTKEGELPPASNTSGPHLSFLGFFIDDQ